MATLRNNSIEIVIGGEKRTLKFGMQACEELTDRARNNNLDLGNSFTVTKVLFSIGLSNIKNKLPDGFGEEMVVDWIDEMEQEEFIKGREFGMQALGFITEYQAMILEDKMGQSV